MNFVRFRKKKVVIGGLWGALIMFIISSIIAILWYNSAKEKQVVLEREYRQKVSELQAWAGQNNTVYSINKDIKAGTKITKGMLQEVVVPDHGAAENNIDVDFLEEDLYARVDLKENTILTQSVVYEEEYLDNDVRENQFSFIVLPDKLKKDGYVDIRIQFPNGDDYILLSKKKAKDLNTATVWMDLNEGEMLTMSSAIVDAYLEEAKIYAVEYIDDLVQKESVITYPVKENVKQLMKESPNIVNIAKFHLEEQNRQRLEKYLSQMADEDKQAVREGEKSSRQDAKEANDQAAENGATYNEVFDENDAEGKNKKEQE